VNHNPLSPEELETCLELMQRMADSYRTMPPNERLLSLIRKLYREGKRRLKQQEIEEKRRQMLEDRAVLASTQLVQVQREDEGPSALPPPAASRTLHNPEYCYVCKAPYTEVHFFYHFLCPQCAQFNYSMRSLHADLNGRTALVTGGRVKIGHQLVLRLLRDGANVLVTTRFPHAAAKRFHAEPDSAEWQHRLRIYGLDLRNIPAVEAFAAKLLRDEPAIDILVHNAAQTIQRPAGFYQELVLQEERPHEMLSLAARNLVAQPAPNTLAIADSSALLPAVVEGLGSDVLPLEETLHDWEERVDSRDINSWLLPLEAVSAREMLEVQLVNSVAPFLLNARLKPLLLRSPFERRFIVNVSAVEGQFSRHKTEFHPHTNMAKAALNMMTRTSAAGYARDGIYMNSVDTGWVTDENPTPKRLRKQEEMGFFAPLDIIDGMARIYHPIALGISHPETPIFGEFLKDYAPSKW
jgi:NAD(P)-dependent dehydrogenase (short-subunit alcohol dehydrogenase family)